MNLKFSLVIICKLLLLNEQGMPTEANPFEDRKAPVTSNNYTYLGWAAMRYWWLANNKYNKDDASDECQELLDDYADMLPKGFNRVNLSWNFAGPKKYERPVIEYVLEKRNIDYAWVSGIDAPDILEGIEKDNCGNFCGAVKKSKPLEEVHRSCCDQYLYFCLATEQETNFITK